MNICGDQDLEHILIIPKKITNNNPIKEKEYNFYSEPDYSEPDCTCALDCVLDYLDGAQNTAD